MPRRGGRSTDIDSLTDLLSNDGFRFGLLCAAGAAAVVALVGLLVGGGPRRNPWAGLAFAAATVAGLDHQSMLPDDLVTGLAVLLVGGLLGEAAVRWLVDVSWAPFVQAVAAAPGAVLVAQSAEVDNPGWVTSALVVVIVAGSALAADFDQHAAGSRSRSRSPMLLSLSLAGLPAALIPVTVFGVWATTPETQHAVVLAGAAIPIALLGWPRPLASLGGAGAALTVGLVAWVGAVDGFARPGAIVGAFGCLGVLALEPLVRKAGIAVRDPWVLAAVHVGLVAVCSRVAGLSTSAISALFFSVLAYFGAVVVLTRVAERTRSGSRRQRI